MPTIRATEEGDENRPVKAMRQKKPTPAVVDRRVDTSLRTLSPADLNSVSAPEDENVRRFHIAAQLAKIQQTNIQRRADTGMEQKRLIAGHGCMPGGDGVHGRRLAAVALGR